MKINFSEKEIQYIKSNFLIERESIKSLFENSDTDIDIDIADEIIDWAGERQQEIGFDENYNLNIEGQLLDAIIDKLSH